MRTVPALFIALIFVTAMGTIHTAWGLQAYPIRLEVSTTSDWTLVNITGLNEVRLFEVKIGENIICTDNGDHITIWIGKRQYDETKKRVVIQFVAIDPSSEIEIQIRKGYIGITDISFKALNIGSFKRIERIVHGQTEGDPAENRWIEIVRLSKLVPYSIELIEETDEPPEVVAAYYPWYSEGGRHWGDRNEEFVSESTHFPLFGTYDSGDPVVLERHVEEASNAGITAFASSWWGIDGYEDWVLGELAHVCEENGFKFTVLYESIRDELLDTPEKVSSDLNYILERYGSSPSFLTWNGRPVIYVFSPGSDDRDNDFWLKVQDQLIIDAVLVGDIRSPILLSAFEGVFNYNELNIENHKENMVWVASTGSYIQEKSLWRFILSAGRHGYATLGDMLTVGTVIPGYDDTKVRNGSKVILRNGTRTYRDYWDVINEVDVDWVFITSWNEWHEGTEIEPSVEHGYEALEETIIQVEKWKRKRTNDGREDCRGS